MLRMIRDGGHIPFPRRWALYQRRVVIVILKSCRLYLARRAAYAIMAAARGQRFKSRTDR
jgi:hypothetical protein